MTAYVLSFIAGVVACAVVFGVVVFVTLVRDMDDFDFDESRRLPPEPKRDKSAKVVTIRQRRKKPGNAKHKKAS